MLMSPRVLPLFQGGTIDQEEEKVKKVLARTMQTVSRSFFTPNLGLPFHIQRD
jgi:hypothetical protein